MTQTLAKPDTIYNHRPIELSPPPITIYHPVFAEFIHLMDTPTSSFSFTAEELDAASKFVEVSAAFYPDKSARQYALQKVRPVRPNFWQTTEVILDPSTTPATVIRPDGLISAKCKLLPGTPRARVSINEVKNGAGEGGSDSGDQSALAWQQQVSTSDYAPIREASCCPAFLVALQGPYMLVSGAVFTDRFISERLTDYIYMGPRAGRASELSPGDAANCEVAKIFQALNKCIGTLTTYYERLQPARTVTAGSGRNDYNNRTGQQHRLDSSTPHCAPLASPSPASFPFWNKFLADGSIFTLTYSTRLESSFPEKAVFKALMEKEGGGEELTKEVVVKFTFLWQSWPCSLGEPIPATCSQAALLRNCARNR